jgi:hypothetical protein
LELQIRDKLCRFCRREYYCVVVADNGELLNELNEGSVTANTGGVGPITKSLFMVRQSGVIVLYAESNCLSREEALRLYTLGSSWFSNEASKKGTLSAGQLADFAVLTEDYIAVPEEEIKRIESVLTVVGGNIVYATEEFSDYAPPSLPVLPEWSPVKVFGGYGAPLEIAKASRAGVPVLEHQHNATCHQHGCPHASQRLLAGIEAAQNRFAGFWGSGCDCFAF